ncbi:hypothetical protein [Mammaliicoccus sp. N-M50]|uniref:hypothetical protein n=1 Tax=Mammaliicoccus sp. N-M50 TaxID=2898709 RepID=UPI001AEC2B9B|nr:hypothetical protein [Mammaliicoccus sp. N-M50]
MTYSTKQVLTLIKEYQDNVKTIARLRKEYIENVCGGNIAQYGIESSMPKAVGQTSDPVFREVTRLLKQDKMLNRYENKIKYVQDRWDRVSDETQETILNQVLSGVSYEEIAKTMGKTPSRISQIVKEIAVIMTD